MVRTLDGPNGVFTADHVKAALRDPNSRNAPRSRLVSVENTSNGGFGTVWPLATLQGVSKVAHDAGLAMHMDGARLCNAAVKAGIKARTRPKRTRTATAMIATEVRMKPCGPDA